MCTMGPSVYEGTGARLVPLRCRPLEAAEFSNAQLPSLGQCDASRLEFPTPARSHLTDLIPTYRTQIFLLSAHGCRYYFPGQQSPGHAPDGPMPPCTYSRPPIESKPCPPRGGGGAPKSGGDRVVQTIFPGS